MADAKMCDICGKFFTCFDGYHVVKMGCISKGGGEKWIRYDACSECYKIIQNTIFNLGSQGGAECRQQTKTDAE